MKKQYIKPEAEAIELAAESLMLAASKADRFEIGMTDEEMNGSDALSNKNENLWDTGDMWQ